MSQEVTTAYCERCDRACARSAALVTILKRTARALHVALGHVMPEDRWFDCEVRECQQRWAVIEGRAWR